MADITVLERDRMIYISLTIILLVLGIAFMYFGPLVFPTPSKVLSGSIFIIAGFAIILISIISIYPKIASLDRAIKYYEDAKELGFNIIEISEEKLIGKKGDIFVCGHEEIDGLFFIKFEKIGKKKDEFFLPSISKSKIHEIFDGIKGAYVESYVSIPVKEEIICGEAKVVFIPLSELKSIFDNDMIGNLRKYIRDKLNAEI